jgi:hypothetical protein
MLLTLSVSGGWCYVFRKVWCYCPQAQPSPGIYLSTQSDSDLSTSDWESALKSYSIVSDHNAPHLVHLTCTHSSCSLGGGLPRFDTLASLHTGIFPIRPRLQLGHIMGLLIS